MLHEYPITEVVGFTAITAAVSYLVCGLAPGSVAYVCSCPILGGVPSGSVL